MTAIIVKEMKLGTFKVQVTENMDGQGAVKRALGNLGGKANKQEIVAELQRMQASASLSKTFSRAINKLHDKREVDRVNEKGTWYYVLTGQ